MWLVARHASARERFTLDSLAENGLSGKPDRQGKEKVQSFTRTTLVEMLSDLYYLRQRPHLWALIPSEVRILLEGELAAAKTGGQSSDTQPGEPTDEGAEKSTRKQKHNVPLELSQRGLMTAEEARQYLSISKRFLDKLIAKHMIPSMKLGGRRLFSRRALDEFIGRSIEDE